MRLKTNQYIHSLGIHLSTSAVNVIELTKPNQDYSVEKFATLPLPRGLIQQHQIQDSFLLSRLVKQAIELSGTKLKKLAISIPDNSIMTHELTLEEQLTSIELTEWVKHKAQELFPYSLTEIYLDFQVFPSEEPKNSSQKILLVAAPKKVIDQYYYIFKLNKLIPQIIEVNSYALARVNVLSLKNFSKERSVTVAMIELDRESMTMVIVHNKKIMYTKEIDFENQKLINLMDNYHNNKQFFSENNFICTKLTTLIQQRLANSCFNYTHPIEGLILSGIGSRVQQLAPILEENLRLKTWCASLPNNFMMNANCDEVSFNKHYPELNISTGLAMRAFKNG